MTFFLTTVLSIFAAVSFAQTREIFKISSNLQNANSSAQFTSGPSGLDAPKVHPINASAFDLWYFDVVSTDPSSLASVVIIFTSESPASGPPVLDPTQDSILIARLWVTFPNGTSWTTQAFADSATVVAQENVSSGQWHGTGFSWKGKARPDSGYRIDIDAPDVGVKGYITFAQVAPAHLPCGPISTGQTMQVGPHIGWANAVPDASSTVDLEIDGEKLVFKGLGYHDKNWGDQLFSHVASWYWGHARVGPYSIVWFDFLDITGEEFVSAYVAKNGRILTASCDLNSLSVRPTGADGGSAYPPVISTPNPSGYHILLDVGEENGRMEFDVDVVQDIIQPNPTYGRFIGNVSGRISVPGGKKGAWYTKDLRGVALFDQFKLTE
ncbi:hypothetical protein R3P38DRAFT_3591328 [Favolaschia claudopus]|uniref:Hydroxyneurosporene synthase n=1 Tax=Favolaschia claudopus TaxID=2862362 RepID=A0AAW0AG30_9AGAR